MLGCGIGKDEYNADKLRYHRIIIMTDADVDGSHIRTLLLTFFYRQMPELVERGHIYIAQPPLYKVKHGKSERYLKDDHELKQYLLKLALADAELHPAADAKPLNQETLALVAKEYFLAEAVIDRMTPADRSGRAACPAGRASRSICPTKNARRKAPRLLKAAVASEGLEIEAKYDEKTETYLAADQAHAARQPAHHRARQRIPAQRGLRADQEDRAGAAGAAGRGRLRQARRTSPARSATSRKRSTGCSTKCSQGLGIQRYKGLGEMNPEQLWETTMDPKVRRLLRAQIEDAISADEIFTTLMGDLVDPRRAFIENNALGVRNLDI